MNKILIKLSILKREFTDYWELLELYINYKLDKWEIKTIDDYFDIINEVFSLYKVSKAEYFTNPNRIPNLNLKGLVYDLWCWVWFWININNNSQNNIIWLDINERWLRIFKHINPNNECRIYDIKKDSLDWDFTLIWNPFFDSYYQKEIFTLIDKVKESYLVIPKFWAEKLSKKYKIDLIETFVNPLTDLKRKDIFTSKMRADAGFLFYIVKDYKIDTVEYFKENVIKKYFPDKEETILPVNESYKIIFESLNKVNKIIYELWDLLNENNILKK